MAAIGTILSVVGTFVSAAGTMAAAKQQEKAAEWQKLEYERQAKSETAAAQRDAEALQHKKDLALSRLQTVAAASGFSATDPTALNVGGEIEKYGTMQQQMAQYGGADRAAGLRAQGDLGVLAAKARTTGANAQAFGTILGGLGSGLSRYGGGGGGAGPSGSFYFG
jgi:cell division protein FtsL